MKTRFIPLLPLFFAGCAPQTTWQSPHTAGEYYAGIHGHSEQQLFATGYNYGANDAMQRMYAAERRAQQYTLPGAQGGKRVSLERKIVPVPVGSYQDANGVVRDGGYRFVELHTVE